VLAHCSVQGSTCAPPAGYSGPCGSMSFKGLGQSQLEDAVLKCRSSALCMLCSLSIWCRHRVIYARRCCSVNWPCAAPADLGFAACPKVPVCLVPLPPRGVFERLVSCRAGLSSAVSALPVAITMVRLLRCLAEQKCRSRLRFAAQVFAILCSPVADFRETGDEGKAAWAARCSASF